MQAVTLKVEPREVVGKKVKKLRQEGLLPISVFGKDVKSQALSVPLVEFAKVYAKAGETGLVELKFGDKALHTLISFVQIHPLSRKPIHAEFHAVKLTEKITANIPIEVVGESPVVTDKTGIILQTLSEVSVEALPTELPEKIEIDATKLTAIDQQVTVGDLKVPSGVAVLTGASEVVLRVAPAVSEETQKEMEAEAATKAAAEAAAAPAEAAPSGAGPAATEEKAPESAEEKKE